MYITIEEYKALYGEISDQDFNRVAYDSCREVDRQTTGIDNVKKLRDYFPEDADDAEAVKRCVCALAHDIYSISQLLEKSDGGDTAGKTIASISSGSESISYATTANIYQTASSDVKAKEELFSNTIKKYLSGVTDKNGVNLLYMGAYPCIRTQ